MKKTTSLRNFEKLTAMIIIACFIGMTAVAAVSAEERWKAAFDEICGKVQNADSLSNQEIAALIEKADKLMPEIQRSEDPAKKVFLQRLKKCRNMYDFMLETRQSGGK